ncbi:MAG: Holliday junction resolvase RecU [Pyramidobacter sp.]|nr:Holliday junction resolvase RecU [Pyramidobacter sp.]
MREQRGKYLERQLDQVLEALACGGVHGHKNHAHRTITGVFLEGEPFDYEVFARGRLHVWDAKECHDGAWNLNTNAKPGQLNNLCMLEKHGADAFFLVYFHKSCKVVKFTAGQVKTAMAEGRKSLRVEDGEEWRWQSLIE